MAVFSVIYTAFLEEKMHLGTKKEKYFFCSALGLHYLCIVLGAKIQK
jgi:hypothetical protein